MLCALIEHPPISRREIAQLLKKNLFGSGPLLSRNIFSEVKVVWTFWQKRVERQLGRKYLTNFPATTELNTPSTL